MHSIPQKLNMQTQIVRSHTIFNNWEVITQGWYLALKTTQLKKGKARSCLIANQRIVFYRGASGKVYALDAFCPHMGVDLGLGKVMGENIRCLFHHWQFNAQGQCVHIPCQEKASANTQLEHYVVEEKYGYIWIWPDRHTASTVLEIPALEGAEVAFSHDKPYYRNCHYHITMVNGIDVQHLRTIHHIDVNMNVSITEPKVDHLQIGISGNFSQGSTKSKLISWFFGNAYTYSMIYAHGTIGGLSMMQNVKLFGKWKVPMLHMLYAYTPLKERHSQVTPIYLTKKRKGILGWIVNHFLLILTKRLFYLLKEEDGMIYENIRFNTLNFLKIDQPIAKYIGFINRLTPSKWSAEVKS